MDLLLNKKNYKKLELLKYLTKHPINNNLQTICIALDLSIPSAKRLILDLNNDLKLNFTEDIYIQLNLTSVLLVNSTGQYSSIDLIEFFNMSYLKESIPFQILLLLFNNKDISINQITNVLFISRSFLYKTIDSLTNPLKGWHIEFNLASKLNSHNLIAKQEHFRIFYSSFFWNTFKQLEWPFESQELILIRTYLSDSNFSFLSLSNLRRIEIYLAITYRMLIEKQFIKLNSSEKQLLQCISDENNLSTPLDDFFKNQHSSYSLTDIENEKFYFNFVVRLAAPNVDNTTQIQKIGNNFSHCNNRTILYSKEFLNSIISEYHIDSTPDVFNEMLYYVVIYFFAFEKLNIDFIAFTKINSYMPKYSVENLENIALSKAIKSSVDAFFQKNNLNPSSATTNSRDIFYNLVYFIVASLQKKKLLVYVQCNKNMHSEPFLTKKLTSIFGNEILKITQFITEADIIITDSNEHHIRENQEVYYFEFTHDLNTWQQLISYLQKKILKLTLM